MANPKICSIAECGKPFYGRDLCRMHWQRLRRHGDPLLIKKPIMKQRFALNHCGEAECPAAKFFRKHLDYVQNPNAADKRAKEWRAANPGSYREKKAKWRAANLERGRSYMASRRARKKQAMPSWLTQDHISQINTVYFEAQRLSAETGISYHVDHIVPLNGRTVCGLHVPWNLRAITATENLRRPKIYMEGMN